MADVSGGRIIWRLDVEDAGFNAKMAAASASATGLGKAVAATGSGFAGFATQASTAFGQVATALGTVLKASLIVAAGLSVALGAAAKSSFDYLTSVQQSTLALKAYTGSAESARTITRDLIAFAKSDVGVLFNRKELLGAAQALAGYGAEATRVTDYVKIMSRAVATGNTTFEELAPILGRIAAQGRITSTDFDVLTGRGIILDKSMRGAAVTFDSLFDAIAGAIPADILDQQANTVNGAIIRLKTGFRELGDAILGVEYGSPFSELGATFTPGGLGDTIVQGIKSLTAAFKSPETVGAIQGFGKQIGGVLKDVLPLLIGLIPVVAKHLDDFAISIGAVGAAFVVARGAAIAFGIAATIAQAAASPIVLVITLIAIAVAAAVIAITFLAIKFGFLDDVIRVTVSVFEWLVKAAKVVWTELVKIATAVWGFVKPAWDALVAATTVLWNAIATMLVPAFVYLWAQIQPILPILKQIAIVFGIIVVGAILIFITAVLLAVAIVVAVVAAIAVAVAWLVDNWMNSWNFIKSAYSAFWNFVKNAVNDGINFIKGIISDGVAFIVGVWSGITRMVAIAAGAISGVVNAIRNGVSNAVGAVTGAIGRFVSAGGDIVAGIARGIAGAAQAVFNAIKAVIGDAVSFAKKILGIGSPSKLFADEIGKPIAEGIAAGIMGGAGSISTALGSVTPSVSGDVWDGGAGSGSAGGGRVNVNVNMAGVMTRSRQDQREVAKDLIESVNEELRSRGVDEIGGGQILGGVNA